MCRLEDCLEEYTRLEVLRDCVCRKCSLVETHRHLRLDIAILEEATKPEMHPSHSKKKRLREFRRTEARVRSALQEGRIEDDIKDVRMERVVSPATKQAMIARVRPLPHVVTYVLDTYLAPTRPRPPHQSFHLRPLCHKEHHPSHLPRSPGHHTIHHLGQSLPQTYFIHIYTFERYSNNTPSAPTLNSAHPIVFTSLSSQQP